MFSFIIPIYNCKKYIGDCVRSIEQLSELDSKIAFEIILINDGSNDGSGQMCNEIAQTNDNITVIHQNNQGVSSARNQGVKKASGDYLVFVDADDTIDVVLLSKVLKELIADTSVDMAIFGVTFEYYHHGVMYRSEHHLPPIEGIYSLQDCCFDIQNLFEKNCLSSLCQRIIKKEILVKNQLELSEKMFLYEDLEFNLRTLPHCNQILFSQLPIYHYKQRYDNAAKRVQRIEHIPDLLYSIEEAFSFLNIENANSIINSIVFEMYTVLIRKKISICNKSEMIIACDDFKQWVDEKKLKKRIVNSKYEMKVYQRKVIWLMINRYYAKTRHRFADVVKRIVGA